MNHRPSQNSHRVINHDGMHRSGTAETVPFQYATRLVSPFVAQLLGQMMADPEQPGSQARAAYGYAERNASLLLDARL